MSQKVVIITGNDFVFTTSSTVGIKEEVESRLDRSYEGRNVSYRYHWFEFGVPDVDGSTGESASDMFIPESEIEAFIYDCSEESAIEDFVNWISARGYQIDEIEAGEGTVYIYESVPPEPDNTDTGFDTFLGQYTDEV